LRLATVESPTAKGIQGPLEKLVALHTSATRLKHLAAEALNVILDALHMSRGALLLFDTRDQTLTLAAARGLSPEGRERLRRVRRNDPASWDIPLHGLLSERAYLIDNPGQNRYVPPLVDEGNASLARIACIPMFRQRVPVGAFVVLAVRSERLTETEIRLSQVWLKYLAAIIDELRERQGVAALTGGDPDGAEGTAPATAAAPRRGDGPRAAADTPIELGADAILPADGEGSAAPPPPDAIEALAEREREARTEASRLREQHAQAVADLTRRTARWEAERAQALAELRAEHERQLAVLGAERDRYAESVASISAALEVAREEAAARAGAAARVADIEAELARARKTAEESARRLAAVESELAGRDARLQEFEDRAATAREESRRAAERAARAEATLAQRTAELAGTSQALTLAKGEVEARGRTIEELRATVAALETAHASAREQLEEAAEHIRSLEATARGGSEETAALVAEIKGAQGREETHRRTIAELSATVARLETKRGELESQLGAAQKKDADAGRTIGELTTTIERLQLARGELVTELDGLRSRDTEAKRTVADLTATVARLDAERGRLAEQCEQLQGRVHCLERGIDAREEVAEAVRTQAAKVAGAERAAVERERELVAELERTRAQLTAREADLARETERLGRERTELLERFATTERLLQETAGALDARSAAEATAVAQLARLRETEGAARRSADEWRAKAEALTKCVSALESAVEVATAEVASVGEQASGAQEESKRWQAEAKTLAERVAQLEEAARVNAQRTAELEARAHAMTLEARGWREAAETAGVRRAEPPAAVEAAEASLPEHAQAGGAPPSDPDTSAAEAEGPERPGTAVHGDGGGTAGDVEPERFVVVEPSVAIGKALLEGLCGHARLVAIKGGLDAVVRGVKEAEATVAAVNLGIRGAVSGFHVLHALGWENPALKLWGYIVPPNATKGIVLGRIECLAAAAERQRLVEFLLRRARRGTRILSVGFDMQTLLGIRKQLGQSGISLSMACDSKQGQELRDMVNAEMHLIDLDLPRGDGYRSIGRLAGAGGPRVTWLLCGGEAPPAEAGSLVATGAMERSAAAFLAPAEIGGVCLEAWGLNGAAADAVAAGAQRSRSRERAEAAAATRGAAGVLRRGPGQRRGS
jgi:archaellum component FlaC